MEHRQLLETREALGWVLGSLLQAKALDIESGKIQ